MLKYIIGATVLATLFIYTSAECVICDSRHDINCLYDNLPSQNCTPWDSQCFVRIDTDGSTVRGCLNTLSGPEQFQCTGQSCQSCTNVQTGIGFHPGCNNIIFPEHRQRCHVCNTGINFDCQGEQTNPAIICPTFVDGDMCFVRREGDNFIRGCVSDDPVCSQAGGGGCYTCIGEGCNFANVSSIEFPDSPGSAGRITSIFTFLGFAVMAILFSQFN
ncbi:uncharacterized protein LOC132266134 [Phlebotomus argentipes]|uniref:uncharacterized protein LOC132266134 n=1 Tax=Phlebotomus argentipes TaxID=94469 RepID=UPI002892AA92|nr:uncharacterized protein LOC132266134 [Phlebotomus argentipes]